MNGKESPTALEVLARGYELAASGMGPMADHWDVIERALRVLAVYEAEAVPNMARWENDYGTYDEGEQAASEMMALLRRLAQASEGE